MEQHVKLILDLHMSEMKLPAGFENNPAIDTCMLVTYKIATCEHGARCRRGDHILESLLARAYNLAVSAIILSAAALYDEALNSIRSLGELANILVYLALHPDDYPNWVLADKKTRISRYSTSAIRKAIENSSKFVPPMDRDTYAELCELSTHVHGATAPNAYGSDGRRHAGGIKQEVGEQKVTTLLTHTMAMVALFGSILVKRDDLFEETLTAVRDVDDSE